MHRHRHTQSISWSFWLQSSHKDLNFSWGCQGFHQADTFAIIKKKKEKPTKSHATSSAQCFGAGLIFMSSEES